MGMSGRCDEKVPDPSPRLTTRRDHGRCQSAIARGDCIIERQCVESTLKHAQPPEPFRAHVVSPSHEDPEVQLGERDCADSQHTGQRHDVLRDDDTGVQQTSFAGL